ncbi:hypothetical protein BX600DRAFT_555804 [Xylariales sp. PMI_506]|nr:hypothetical protein BX600DRAFT_555804 [Xylariales sp. PMI_506]
MGLPSKSGVTALATLLVAAVLGRRLLWGHLSRRTRRIAPSSERVLVLGASSGVGRAVVKRYAARGARVCAVARRAEALETLALECGGGSSSSSSGGGDGGSQTVAEPRVIYEVADFTSVQDMIRVRERLLREWGGLDSIHIVAGVSALQPVLSLAGVDENATGQEATEEGIEAAVAIAGRAMHANFNGPLVSALAFIPMLLRTSVSPSILLVSTVAAIIPAPTRALYAASKSASLLLYEALAIEHPGIAFTFLLPATIEGDFRAGAVDSHIGGVREKDPNKSGLRTDVVAARCISALDEGYRGSVIMPWFPYAIGHHIYYLLPSFVEWRARVKYRFEPDKA